MKLAWQAHSLSKEGNGAAENEDALAISKETSRVAVCDGASEGWGSGLWAAHLAKALVSSPAEPQSFNEWLGKVRATATFAQPQVVSWYAEAKSAQGAFCTLLSLAFSTSKDGGVKYHAVAVGDTALFHLREDKLIARFPIEHSNQFSNVPALVGSTVESGQPVPEWFAGRAEVGDRFYLLTDALAEWFLRSAEKGDKPWDVMDAVTSAHQPGEAFADWVQSLRDKKHAKNDDATMVRVKVL